MYELYYYRARYYDPSIGRFISSDPIEFLAGDINFFRYVGGSPVNFRDPFGLCPPCVVIAIIVLRKVAVDYAKKELKKKLKKELKEELKERGQEATNQEINEAMSKASEATGIKVEGLKTYSECGEKDKYKSSKKKKYANNGKKGKNKINFHRDHIPADSVMQARARDIARDSDMKVCPKASSAIRANAKTITLPDFIHIDGRTFGSKVKPLIATDKNNLGKAAKDDIQASKDAVERAEKKKKIDKKCADAIKKTLEQMPKTDKAYTKIINDALALC